MSKSKPIVIPKEDIISNVIDVVIQTTGVIPQVGSTIAEILNKVIETPYKRRVDAWREEVTSVLNDLKEKDEQLFNELPNNDKFVNAVFKATDIILRTTESEKVIAAKSAMFNAATDQDINEIVINVFMRWIDELTVSELKIVKVARDPRSVVRDLRDDQEKYSRRTQISVSEVIEDFIPSMRNEKGLLEYMCQNLYQLKILNTNGFLLSHVHLPAVIEQISGTEQSYLSPLGNKFYEFIKEYK